MEVSFIRDAITKIQQMSYEHFQQDGRGNVYYDNGTRPELLEPPLYYPRTVELSSLDALCKLVRTEAEDLLAAGDRGKIYISVPTATRVEAFTTPFKDLRQKRITLCVATATDIPGFKDTTYGYEQAIIALRSRFQPSEDQAYILDLMSHLVSGQEIVTEDDGITQSVKINAGIQMTRMTRTKPIVKLCPYRTFQEVCQPESDFLIRLDDKRNLTISEADGGMWRLAARKAVASWLELALQDEIADGFVVVML